MATPNQYNQEEDSSNDRQKEVGHGSFKPQFLFVGIGLECPCYLFQSSSCGFLGHTAFTRQVSQFEEMRDWERAEEKKTTY